MPLPTWELTKEIADRLPGRDKDESKDESKDARCETCGASQDEQDMKTRKGRD